ncbi:MAG TPA: protein kinase [Polyangiaceae bacterium]|nr:protein kinase [Polyangiaceae bacterium]
MLEAPIPADEERRLALLKACNIMYTPDEEAFDDVARLAADLCGTEIALITLVGSDRQWFKSRVGVEQTEIARDLSFCGHCIHHKTPFVVEDTHLDRRFADNPLVVGDPRIRFYVGVPLLLDSGSSIGALSVADRSPRTITDRQLRALESLARQISRELRLRRDLARASKPPAHDYRIGPGMTVGERWRVVRALGRGAVGAVFEAHDAAGQRVAIKVLHRQWRQNEQLVERFAREARVLMRLTNAHVGKLIDVGNLDEEQGDLPYLVLEYLEGSDLDERIVREGRLPFRQAFAWGADACEGVAEAHELGVIHRDLKPSNVFLSGGPKNAPVVKVLDFGIAAGEPSADAPSKLTNVDGLLGSPAYMPPEQMMSSADVDARSDIWSMGALLYHAVTGKLPFPGAGHLEIFSKAMTRPPVPLRVHVKEAPAEVEAVILKCLRKQRTDRYASMTELATALRAASSA